MTELHYQSLSDTCRQLKSGARSAVGLTEYMLARIAELDPQLNSYACVLSAQALEQAQQLDADQNAGKPLGALHGVPIAIKDLLFTKGIVTASGTRVMADFVPEIDATVVTRLRAAGAVIIGKTQLTEGAFGAHHPAIQAPKNPWNTDHWPGVSSSGSGVAVAAGLAFGALGTDTGGSIRFPSASCGLVGIKPTYGRVSRYGAFALAQSLDHIGPMTRTVEDAARLLGVIAGADVNDATCLTDPVPDYGAQATLRAPAMADRLVIGVDWDYVQHGVDAEVVATVEAACAMLSDLGHEIREVTMPPECGVLIDEWGVTCGFECARAHRDYYPARQAEYGPVLSALLDLGLSVSQEKYDELAGVRDVFRRNLDQILAEVDLLITPCMTSLPPTVEQMAQSVDSDESRAAFITFTAPFDYSGHPTLTLPAGLSANGLPTSFQLVGRHLAEPTLIQMGIDCERALGAMAHPPV